MSVPRRRTTIALAALVLGGAVVTSQAGASAATSEPASSPVSASTATLPADVKADLTFSRDEERMARDLYQSLAAKYGSTTVFARIAQSEQRHYEAIGTLLSRYGIADPAAGKPAGTFANADIQKLYDGWLARGLQSSGNAYQVGIELEKRDIADLERMTSRTTATDITRVYSRLLAASKQHLSAFTAAAQGTSACPANQGGQGQGPRQGQTQRQGQGRGQGPGAGMTGRGNGPGLGRGTGPGAGPGAQRASANPATWSATA